MNFWTIAIFLVIRVLMYAALRLMHIRPLPALVGVVTSYAMMQQWVTIKDFSMFVALLGTPILIFTWYKSVELKQYVPLFTGLAGLSWSLHPVLGYSSAFLGLFLAMAHRSSINLTSKTLILLLFLLSVTPFFLPYGFSGYYYSNPILSSPQFLRDTIISEQFGMSLLYIIFLTISWASVLVFSTKTPRWAKLLLLASSLYILLIKLGQENLLPTIVNKLQISRAITLIGFLLSFVFAAVAQTALRKSPSRFMTTILLVIICISTISAVSIASVYSAQPVVTIVDPVSGYFAHGNPEPTGSVYYPNVSEASYFAPSDVRFATSYNEHLEPHPLAQRFRILNRSDIAFTGISDQQLNLITDYSLGMGIELLFVPDLAPSIAALTTSKSATPALFEQAGEINTPSGQFTVLRNKQPIAYAYVLTSDQFAKLSLADLPKPTLEAQSFKPWDAEMQTMVQLIRSSSVKPVPLTFKHPDKLHIDVSTTKISANSMLLITQSYDQNWRVVEDPSIPIQPTALRFMYLPINSATQTITLQNSWPIWHWPVQALGGISVAVGAVWSILWLRQKPQPIHPKVAA
ncbi:hypothetical protein KBC79_02280 [Candidatus Woesebacteria bacterium]|nr:hypothetical protein [Candidatus Woesebacteria bacterium]